MKNLEDAQREMRERNARKKRGEDLVQREIAASEDSPEVLRLKGQISALITENNRLRQQKTIVVERSRGQDKSYDDSVKEQQRNFFKYSNVRRYEHTRSQINAAFPASLKRPTLLAAVLLITMGFRPRPSPRGEFLASPSYNQQGR